MMACASRRPSDANGRRFWKTGEIAVSDNVEQINTAVADPSQWDGEVMQLNDKGARVQRLLNSLEATGPASNCVRILLFLMSKQFPDGSWGSHDYPNWKVISTVQAIQSLARVGLARDTEWELTEVLGPRAAHFGYLARAYEWLLSVQSASGSWGDDSWDTCQTIRLLIHSGRSIQDPALQKGIAYLRRTIESDWEPDRKKPWFGPAFFASAAEVFHLVQDQAMTDNLIERTWALQDSDSGRFGTDHHLMDEASSSAWHTAWVMSSIRSIGIPNSSMRLQRAYEWLKHAQSDDGSWGRGFDWDKHIFVLAGVTAANAMEGSDCETVRRGLNWYLDRQQTDGNVLDVHITCTAADAFTLVYGEKLHCSLPFIAVLDALDVIRRQRTLIQNLIAHTSSLSDVHGATVAEKNALLSNIQQLELDRGSLQKAVGTLEERTRTQKEQLEALHRQLSSYWIRITEKQIGITGLLLGLVGALLTVATVLVNSLHH